ncbi:NEDD8-activating enzyme E1 regulatory subunit [Smittium culicis]|uniref:NEDD8-activating enzyme E1 regulatory subunit n=1 Tax=Smittium culicis TaxID=133412 RepID=A0A1R1XFR7_9FUNG|nr:NEDD8-activating enzyme E1 regulatory subunit [Smittium culicis]
MSDSLNNKYDRQIRLWNTSGQADLSNSRIACFGANILSAEVLKNLVLPGIGSFHLFDSATVTQADLESNFFLTKNDIGKLTSLSICTLLTELNPEVQGFHGDFESVKFTPSFFKKFSIVILCNQSFQLLSKVLDICWDLQIPVIDCVSNGFLGSLHTYISEHCVVESHDVPTDDLGIINPFEEILSYSSKYFKSENDDSSRNEIPYIIILIKKLQEYKSNNDGRLPTSFKEKKAFKDFLASDSYYSGNDNFNEALENSIRYLSAPSINSELLNIFGNDKCKNILSNLNKLNDIPFWASASALRQFYYSKDQGNLTLPINDSIPDMHSSTFHYTNIHQIYKNKFKADSKIVHSNLIEILKQLPPTYPTFDISLEKTELFCRNARNLRVISNQKPVFITIGTSQLAAATATNSQHTPDSTTTSQGSSNPDKFKSSCPISNSLIIPKLEFSQFDLPEALLSSLYAFRSINSHIFTANNCAKSGITLDEIKGENSNINIENIVSEICKNLHSPSMEYTNQNTIHLNLGNTSTADVAAGNGADTSDDDQAIDLISKVTQEIMRSRGLEIHTTSAAVGGLVAQESIKMITNQYIPSNNTTLYDSIHGSIYSV